MAEQLPPFDPRLSRAALVVEGDDSLNRASQVGDDEARAWAQLRLDITYVARYPKVSDISSPPCLPRLLPG
jgi:hypothetical protein